MKLGLVLALALAATAQAKVEGSGPSGFAVSFEGDVKAAPADAYAKFLQIGSWWSSEHTYTGDAKNLSITDKPGGCWCETLPSGFVQHMQVVNAEPGRLLVLGGGLGPLQFLGVAGSMMVTFEPEDGGTHVTLRYSVGGYDPDNFAKLPAAVDGVIGAGFESFKAFADK